MPSPRAASSASARPQLQAGLAALGLALPAGSADRLLIYLAELEKWNAAYNLTAVRDPRQMVTRHLLDSLAVLPALESAAAPAPLVDVGSGAGLPGLVLAVARPQWPIALLDSNGKKARFMRHAARTLGLDNVEVIECRAQAWRPPGGFASVVSRAYASLADFVETTRHLVAAGGQWVAMKGKLDPTELAGLPPDCSIRETRPLTVPGLHEERHAVIVTSGPP